MAEQPLRIGLIVPSSNTVMEPDFHRYLGDTCTISTCRIFLESVDPEAEKRMLNEELPRSLRLIKTTAPDIVVFGCTSAGSLGGVTHDQGIAKTISEETGSEAITVVESILTQLRLLLCRRVALFTPYREALTQSVAGCLAESGYDLATTMGMGILQNRDIGEVPPAEIVRFVDANMAGCEADCIFLSCTNWQAIGAMKALKDRHGIPVISSNQAVIEAIRRLL